jgi:hypothetical protein
VTTARLRTSSATVTAPPFTDADKQAVADHVYQHVWQQAMRGNSARAL